jgi:hypothetical protein
MLYQQKLVYTKVTFAFGAEGGGFESRVCQMKKLKEEVIND